VIGTLVSCLGWIAFAGVIAGQASPPAPASRSESGSEIARAVEVKAGLFYQFAKFTNWPGAKTETPLVFCVVGDDKVATVVSDVVRGMSVAQRTLEVRRSPDRGRWRECHLLFLADAGSQHWTGELRSLRTQPVLTVSDSKGFARSGGIIELYVHEGKMRFVINRDAADDSGLRLASQLLHLADTIRDGHAR
jgi:hypothetical protein